MPSSGLIDLYFFFSHAKLEAPLPLGTLSKS